MLIGTLVSLKMLEKSAENPLLYKKEIEKSKKIIIIGSLLVILLPLTLKIIFSSFDFGSSILAKLPASALKTIENSGFTDKFNLTDLRYALTLIFLTAISYGTLAVFIKKNYIFKSKALICAAAIICAASYTAYLANDSDLFNAKSIYLAEAVTMPAESEETSYSYRTDFETDFNNIGMVVNKPSINTFNSFKSTATADFCSLAGFSTDSFAKKSFDTNAIEAVLSIKEYVHKEGVTEECKNYVPMGFEYDYYIEADSIAPSANIKENNNRIENMCRACYISSSNAAKLNNIIEPLGNRKINIDEAIAKARKTSCTDLIINQNSVSAKSYGDKKRLIYFSIPNDNGWKAYVNGAEAEIFTINGGMISIIADKGESNIYLKYETPGLRAGAIISLISFCALISYEILCKRKPESGAK